jgi:hypothetical protein
VALFSKYAGSKQGVSAEKLVEALVEEYHSGELARAITRAEHDWLISHLGSDAAKKSANRTRGMQLAELKEKSGAAEREKGLAAARVEVVASLDASLRTAKGPPNINPAAGKSVLRLASGLQKHVDRFDEILATGHKIKVATHLRTAESALGCGAFHPALSPRSPIAKRRVIWYADFRGRMPLDESMTKQASIDAFNELLNAKQIAPTTKVWVEGWQDWRMFRQVGLEGLLQSAVGPEAAKKKAQKKAHLQNGAKPLGGAAQQQQQPQPGVGARAKAAGGRQQPALVKATLDHHNSLRAKHGAQPLKWSDECAASAQKQADACQRSRKLFHGFCEGPSGGHGQNAYWHSASANPEQAIQSWYDEVNKPGYDFKRHGFAKGTGHFTQVVWVDTRSVGLAISKDGKYIVANCERAAGLSSRLCWHSS